MGYQFNDEDKEVREFAETLPFGVNKVNLLLAEAGQTEAGKDYIELNFVSEQGIEDKARVWFVGKASNISFNTLLALAIHNQSTDKAKEEMRQAFESLADSEELCNLLNEKCMNGEFWVTKYYDPERTYQNNQGQTRRSINKNIYGYEPKLKPELMPRPANADGTPADNQTTPGNDAATNIPKSW
jgi:hypothetical protein